VKNCVNAKEFLLMRFGEEWTKVKIFIELYFLLILSRSAFFSQPLYYTIAELCKTT
jgi:hypothetical protein